MGYCSSSSYKFSVNGWRVMAKDDDGVYIVSAGAPECIKTYTTSKSSSTSSGNFIDSLTYLTSSTATYSDSTYTLGTTTSYTFPNNISSLNGKYTCGDDTTTSCSSPYLISTNSSRNTLTLNEITPTISTTCTSSTSSSSGYYRNCQFHLYNSSSSSYTYYYGTSYTLTSGGNFQLSGTLSTSSTAISDRYTCKSPYSTQMCSTLYYITGNVHTATASSSTTTEYVYASYKSYQNKTTSSLYFLSSNNYLFSTGYEFDINTGKYTLTDTSSLNWESDYNTIMNNKKYTCFTNNNSCSTMYEITSDSTSDEAIYYTYTSTYDTSDNHISRLNQVAQTYCNTKYLKDGVCDETTAWAMNGDDFQRVTGSTLSTCRSTSSTSCGKSNALIDNGGIYWFGSSYSSSYIYRWNPSSSYLTYSYSNNQYGIRPVLYLKSNVSTVSGSGTYEDPYQLSA